MPHVVAGASESTRRHTPSPASRSFSPSSIRVRIPIATEADVALAGEQGRRIASRLAFSPTDITVIATAILEVGRNVLQYARRGDVVLHLVHKRGRLGLSIIARDKGPGIRDIAQALRDGHGVGLASIRRLMDEFRIRSEPGHGTTVAMRKWTSCRHVERAGARRPGHPGMRDVR